MEISQKAEQKDKSKRRRKKIHFQRINTEGLTNEFPEEHRKCKERDENVPLFLWFSRKTARQASLRFSLVSAYRIRKDPCRGGGGSHSKF